MNQGQLTIDYDQFMPKPFEERLGIFNEISAENRALLIKTHLERWLAANRHRLVHEQIVVVEEFISFIAPELYQTPRDEEKVMREVEALRKKAEAVLSPGDMVQVMSDHPDYVPAVEGKKG